MKANPIKRVLVDEVDRRIPEERKKKATDQRDSYVRKLLNLWQRCAQAIDQNEYQLAFRKTDNHVKVTRKGE